MVSLALAIAIVGKAKYIKNDVDDGVFILFLFTGVLDLGIAAMIMGVWS